MPHGKSKHLALITQKILQFEEIENFIMWSYTILKGSKIFQAHPCI